MQTKEQLCWNCRKATNKNLCSWAGGILPEGVVKESGFIVSCPCFERDGVESLKPNKMADGKDYCDLFKTIAKEKYNISERTYFIYKRAVRLNKKVNKKTFQAFKEDYFKFYNITNEKEKQLSNIEQLLIGGGNAD
jgi:hypothetical protein